MKPVNWLILVVCSILVLNFYVEGQTTKGQAVDSLTEMFIQYPRLTATYIVEKSLSKDENAQAYKIVAKDLILKRDKLDTEILVYQNLPQEDFNILKASKPNISKDLKDVFSYEIKDSTDSSKPFILSEDIK